MAAVANGTDVPEGVQPSAGPPMHPQAASQPKRRTTINTTTGQWALGKTIGAGSMGKVKLAKNMETGEQVSQAESLYLSLTSVSLLI